MKKIIEDLGSPEWWFSVLVIGVIAALIAAYLKDVVPMVTSKVSRSMANRRQAILRRRTSIKILIQGNPSAAAAMGLRFVIEVFFWVFFAVTTIALPMINQFYSKNPELDLPPSLPIPGHVGSILVRFASFAAAAMTIILSFQLPRRLEEFVIAYNTAVGERLKSLEQQIGKEKES